jgi:hypothetical protein
MRNFMREIARRVRMIWRRRPWATPPLRAPMYGLIMGLRGCGLEEALRIDGELAELHRKRWLRGE